MMYLSGQDLYPTFINLQTICNQDPAFGMRISELTTGDSQATDQVHQLANKNPLLSSTSLFNTGRSLDENIHAIKTQLELADAVSNNQKSVPKLECKGSRVLMMNKNGYLEDNNGYGIFKSSGILKAAVAGSRSTSGLGVNRIVCVGQRVGGSCLSANSGPGRGLSPAQRQG
ncbi:hypothetical protein EK904_004613 [Melospiza melodia maxima]|nr:hypothetical protein EK904_004613 [Melospiza melodia maxima]